MLTEKLKNCIDISVCQAVLELLIKTCKIRFWSITQEPLVLLKFQCHFWVSQTICFRVLTSWYFWDCAQNVLNFGLGCTSPFSTKGANDCEGTVFFWHDQIPIMFFRSEPLYKSAAYITLQTHCMPKLTPPSLGTAAEVVRELLGSLVPIMTFWTTASSNFVRVSYIILAIAKRKTVIVIYESPFPETINNGMS